MKHLNDLSGFVLHLEFESWGTICNYFFDQLVKLHWTWHDYHNPKQKASLGSGTLSSQYSKFCFRYSFGWSMRGGARERLS